MTDRFRPTRAGIIEIWNYQRRTFRFDNGHLVLRGPNGSGKTKALELLFPFVLDGSYDARRLDPFSGQARTMRSNLLYEGDKQRLGYCWMEFARGDEVVSIGIGLSAQASSQDLKWWSFVADGRVDDDIQLVNARNEPITRRNLVKQLGEAAVHTTREAHRAAVDRRLFGLGPERYASLLDLLLTLRRPQLAKDLDPDALSRVLSDGLRTVDREQLRNSAEAFDDMEATQRQLADLQRAQEAVRELLVTWKKYLRARARSRVERFSEKQGQLRRVEAELASLEIQTARAQRAVAQAEDEEEAAEKAVDTLAASIEALKAHSAYQNQGQLDDARENAEQTAGFARKQRARLERAQVARNEEAKAAAGAEQALKDATSHSGEAWTLLAGSLDAAGFSPVTTDALDDARGWLTARGASCASVLALVNQWERALYTQELEEKRLQEVVAQQEGAREALKDAKQALATVLASSRTALERWLDDLPPPLFEALDAELLLDRIDLLGDGADLPQHVNEGWRPTTQALHTVVAEQKQLIGATTSKIAEIDEQIETVRAERDDAPAAPAARLASREGRAGAPLWKLVRFRKAVSDADCAGLEGALLSSGVLDAWVSPADDDPTAVALEDTALLAAPVNGPTLADLLVPEPDQEVPVDRILAVLQSLPLDGSTVQVRPDGTFRLGPLVGSHRPEAARFIGATARARYRRERIADLTARRQQRESELLGAHAAHSDAQALLNAMQVASAKLPDPQPAKRAHLAVNLATAEVATQQKQHAQAETSASRASRASQEARRRVRSEAMELGVPDTRTALEQQQQALSASSTALVGYDEATRALAAAQSHHEEANLRLASREAEHRASAADLAEAEAIETTARTRYNTLMASVGVEIQQINRQLEESEAQMRAAASALKEARQASKDASNRFHGLHVSRQERAKRLPELRDDVDHARARLAPFEQLELRVALGVQAGDEAFEERLATTVADTSFTDEYLKTTETQLNNRVVTLDQELGSDYRYVRESRDDVTVLSIDEQGGRFGLAVFADRLEDRVTQIGALMDEKEEALLADQLLTTLCGQLGERIRETELLVDMMDKAMRKRRMTSQKSVGIRWKLLADTDDTRKSLLDLLHLDAAVLSPERLATLRHLLTEEVRSARQERQDRAYLQILEDAFDYRRWYHFELTLFDATGGSSKLTRRAHSKLSGGEKAAAVHLPLFAAVHAQLQAGRAECPRMFALDEAFAGIDETGVPALLQLASQFDLDWFFTGHDLWITEEFLPGVMHYALSHDPLARVVDAWPILWNGTETIEGEGVDL